MTMFATGMRPTLTPTVNELRSGKPPVGRQVVITCDAVHGPVWEETNDRGTTTSQIAMCELGKYLLPVKLDADAAIPPREIKGRLSFLRDTDVWVKDGLRNEPDLDNRSLDVFVTYGDGDRGAGFVGLLFVLATPVAWFLYFRSRRRAKRAAATSS